MCVCVLSCRWNLVKFGNGLPFCAEHFMVVKKIGGSDPLLLSLHLLTEADYGTVDIVGIDVIL